jgi:hypothetical protein
LNQIPPTQGGPTHLLVVDGLVGPKTIGAISKFQKFHFGWSDGRVDTNNVTIAKLNELTAAPGPTPPGPFPPGPGPIPPGPGPKPPGPPFRFEESAVNNGFDRKVTPHWQMVPLSGFKLVNVVNAAGLTFSCNKPAIATVVQISPTQIRIGGLAKGTALIEARDAAGKLVGTLEIAVKAKKTVATSYFNVEDSATPKKHTTTRKVGDEVKLTQLINAIYLPQANIEFTVRSAQPLPIAQNLGNVVRWALNIPGVPSARMNGT